MVVCSDREHTHACVWVCLYACKTRVHFMDRVRVHVCAHVCACICVCVCMCVCRKDIVAMCLWSHLLVDVGSNQRGRDWSVAALLSLL